MENHAKYVVHSLELHLFFARIMKEHSLFLEAGFPPPNADFAREAEQYKTEFEKLLLQAVQLSDGVVGQDVLQSGEIVTEFTNCAEEQTERLTGIQIDRKITRMEACLRSVEPRTIRSEQVRQVKRLNQTAIRLLNGLIAFKEKTLRLTQTCGIFTTNYPLLIEHILREARLYRTYVVGLESGRSFNCQSMRQIEQFWNRIMMEHALFIRGLLDPSENELVDASDEFAEDYARLLAASKAQQDRTLTCSTEESLAKTLKFRDFKAAGTKGIQTCQIRSIILPLLADHVLREANHYIRLLKG